MHGIANAIAGMFAAFMLFGLPILLIFGKSHIQRWFDLKERRMLMIAEQSGEQAGRTAARMELLEQRVAVLERIATDRSVALSDEIDRLRGDRVN